MATFERKVIYAVNGTLSCGKHKLVERIKHFFKNAKVVEFSEEDKEDFQKECEKCFMEKKSKKITSGFLAKSFEKYNQNMKYALQQEDSKIVIVVNCPSFLFSLYQGLICSLLSEKNMVSTLQDYNEMIKPHHVINLLVRCDPKEALENWIRKEDMHGSFLTIHDFLEMFNNILNWIYIEKMEPISVHSNMCDHWNPSFGVE